MFWSPLFSKSEAVNKLVGTFIVSETLLWSGWNFIYPIIALYIVGSVQDATVETVATAFSVYLITRVVAELISGRYVSNAPLKVKVWMVIGGQIVLSFAYLGFIVASSVLQLFMVYMVIGIGLGASVPAKLGIFSTHLDKNKESKEWSYYNATSLLGMAISGIIAGIIAQDFGFDVVFVLASLINLLGVIPYFFFFKRFNT